MKNQLPADREPRRRKRRIRKRVRPSIMEGDDRRERQEACQGIAAQCCELICRCADLCCPQKGESDGSNQVLQL